MTIGPMQGPLPHTLSIGSHYNPTHPYPFSYPAYTYPLSVHHFNPEDGGSTVL